MFAHDDVRESDLISLEMLSRMFDHTAAAVLGFDPSGRIVLLNETACALFGYTQPQLSGRRCYEIVKGTDTRGNLQCHQGCSIMVMFRRNQPPQDYLLRTRDTAGNELLLNVSTLFVETERCPVCLHFFHDVRWMIETPPATAKPARAGTPAIQLTAREREILQLMVEGLDSHEMAKVLHISYATIRNHIQNILDKLEVHTRVAAVVVAIRENLVSDPSRPEQRDHAVAAELPEP